MARSSKGARNITVAGVHYRWRATGNDGWISISIWPAELPHAGVYAMLTYDETSTERRLPSGEQYWRLSNQLVVTARIIRRVIDHAVEAHGFDPRVRSTQLDLRSLDGVIDVSDAERAS